MMPRLDASTAAPPTPCSTRIRTKLTTSGETAASREATASSSEPATNVRRRPVSSAIVPVESSVAPSPMLIELRIQVRPAGPVPSAAAVLFRVASGAVNATRVSSVPAPATPRVLLDDPWPVPTGTPQRAV
jgi:hypothetical protein